MSIDEIKADLQEIIKRLDGCESSKCNLRNDKPKRNDVACHCRENIQQNFIYLSAVMPRLKK